MGSEVPNLGLPSENSISIERNEALMERNMVFINGGTSRNTNEWDFFSNSTITSSPPTVPQISDTALELLSNTQSLFNNGGTFMRLLSGDEAELENLGGCESSSIDDDWNAECEDTPAFSETELDDGFDSDISSSSNDEIITNKDDKEVACNDNDYYGFNSEDDNDIVVPKFLTNGNWFSYQGNGKIKLEVGLMFENKPRFLSVIQSYAIQEGFSLDKLRNTKEKFWATCKKTVYSDSSSEEESIPRVIKVKSCPWRVYASLLADGLTFQIKTLNNTHTCTRIDKNPTVKHPWIADVLKEEFKKNTLMNVRTMKELLIQKFGIRCKKSKLYRARSLLKDLTEGSHKESYARLSTYIQLILERSPQSICGIVWKTLFQVPRPLHVFSKLFISFEGLHQGFSRGCRPFIGVDGSHLRGKYGGTLLIAAALDGDNGILSLAYSVVDKETKETWSFFFYHLKRIANEETRNKWVIMSDRQKGVESALDEQLPTVSRRICARHFYANFKQKWPGDLMKNFFWTASKAHSEFVFINTMEQMKKFSREAYNYLMDVPQELWARHKFDNNLKVGEVTNNFVESFNGKIREIRALPILSMLEEIRRKTMKKLHKKRRMVRKWTTNLCPRVDKMVQQSWDDGFFCIPISAGSGLYDVKDGTSYLNVDLGKGTCDCRSWQNLGIPCKHVASVIRFLRRDIRDYVHPYYTKTMYLQTYEGVIHPIPDSTTWCEDDQPFLQPPELTRRCGRPRTQRHKEKGEQPKTKRSTQVKCSTCKCFGHNKRSCQGGKTKKQTAELQNGTQRKKKKRSHAIATGTSSQLGESHTQEPCDNI